jgi:hypothetical protein
MTAGSTGRLELNINDNLMTNNSGHFEVTVEFEGGIF